MRKNLFAMNGIPCKIVLRDFIVFLMCAFLLEVSVASGMEWEEVSGEHFLVYYTRDKDFAKSVAAKAEKYYTRIATELGYPRYSDFWTWDDRVKIYIYPDHASFINATDMPQWSHGMADYTLREIASYRESKEFLDSLLPHEMAHLIFRDFVGFAGEVPLWLDEGVAQWAEEKKRSDMKAMAVNAYIENKLLLLDDLMNLDVRRLKEMDRVYIRPTITTTGEPGVLFLSVDALVSTYYLCSVSLIGFLIERYGSLEFADFCRELRDGKTVEDALRHAYPGRLRSLQELQDRWREHLAEQAMQNIR